MTYPSHSKKHVRKDFLNGQMSNGHGLQLLHNLAFKLFIISYSSLQLHYSNFSDNSKIWVTWLVFPIRRAKKRKILQRNSSITIGKREC